MTDALHAPRDRRSGDAAVIRAARRLGSGPHTDALLLAGADGRLHVGIQTAILSDFKLCFRLDRRSGGLSLATCALDYFRS